MGNDYFETIDEMKVVDVPLGIGTNCYIEQAIIDKNCRIGNNVSIKGGDILEDKDTDTYCIRDGIVVLKKGAIIPDNSKIGV